MRQNGGPVFPGTFLDIFGVFFFEFFVFYFIKISKFALPGVMLMYERTSKDRKKERKILDLCLLPYFNVLGSL